MKKESKQKAPRVRKEITDERTLAEEATDDADTLDWQPLFTAFREAFDWALDVAVALARDFPEEVEAVERVRTFMRARLRGHRANVSIDDVLFTFGLLIGAIERDLGPVNMLGPWFAPPLTMQFPTAREHTQRVPRVLITRPQWSRGPSTHFVA